MFYDPGLNEESAFLWIESDAQPVDDHIGDIVQDLPGVTVIAGQRVPVGHEIETLVTIIILKIHPVFQRTVQVAKMKLSRGPHSTQYSFCCQSASPSVFPSLIKDKP